MKIIYVAGKYTAWTKDKDKELDWSGIEHNIRTAEMKSIKLWRRGWAVITPHLNTAHYERYEDSELGLSYKTWIEGDLAILLKCDAMFVMKGWKTSKGTKGEIKFAKEHNIPVFYEGSENDYPCPEELG